MSQEVTNEEETVSLVEVAKGATELLAGKGFTLQSDYVTTKFSKCKPNECPWKKKEVLQRLDSGYNWPFRGWLADEVWVLILFEYDGCDVNNARLTLSPKSFSKWYNDKALFSISAKGAASRITEASGCLVCCERAAVVEFDVYLDSRYDLVKADVLRWTVRLSGNGSVQITAL